MVTGTPFGRLAPYDLPRERVMSLSPFGVWNQGFWRYGPHALRPWHQVAFAHSFDRVTSRLLDDCDIFNGWASTSLLSLRAMQRRGTPTVIQTGSAHIRWQQRILAEELARVGLRGELVRPSLVERTVQEYEEADAVVVPSEFARRTFAEEGIDPAKVAVVRETVPSQPAPAPDHRSKVVPQILFVGHADVRKGFPYLLEAFRQLRSNAVLRVVGHQSAALMAALQPLPDRVELVGPRPHAALQAEYAAADVFVLPSVEDGFGLVVAEAMSAGLPVVVSENVGSAELIEEGVSGFVVPARDARSLADRLSHLLEDAELRRRVGLRAREAAVGRSWEDYGADLDAAHRGVLNRVDLRDPAIGRK